jgi:spore coat polysaccharide biosynthesis protein SpsF (cytidylyltransferase family)
MKLVATLACRNNSRRLYGKPMQLLENFSVVEYIIKNLKKVPEIYEIVLAISSEKGNEVFIDIAEKQNLRYVLGDDRNVLLRLIRACELVGGDTIYRVTTESPFGYVEGIVEAIEAHKKLNADYTAFANLPDGVMFEIISLKALKLSQQNGEHKHRSELVSLYINEHPEIFIRNIIEVPADYQRPDYRLTIDFPEDLILCRKIIRHFGGDDKYIPYKELISFLDENPELQNLVANITDANYIKPYQ